MGVGFESAVSYFTVMGTLVLGTKILVPRSWYQDPGSKILEPGPWYQDPVTGINEIVFV